MINLDGIKKLALDIYEVLTFKNGSDLPILKDTIERNIDKIISSQNSSLDMTIQSEQVFLLKQELSKKRLEAEMLRIKNDKLEEELKEKNIVSTKVARITIIVGMVVGALITGIGQKLYNSGKIERLQQENSSLKTSNTANKKRISELEALTGQQTKIIELTQDIYKKDFIQVGKTIGGILTQVGELKDVVSHLSQNSSGLKLDKNINPEIYSTFKETQESKVNFTDNSETYYQVQKLIKEVKQNLPEGLEIKVALTKNGRINVWSEFGNKRSIGYYADSEKFKDRLKKENFESWLTDRYNNFLFIGQVEFIISQTGLKNLEIKETYSGNIEVKIHGKNERVFMDCITDNENTIKLKLNKLINL